MSLTLQGMTEWLNDVQAEAQVTSSAAAGAVDDDDDDAGSDVKLIAIAFF